MSARRTWCCRDCPALFGLPGPGEYYTCLDNYLTRVPRLVQPDDWNGTDKINPDWFVEVPNVTEDGEEYRCVSCAGSMYGSLIGGSPDGVVWFQLNFVSVSNPQHSKPRAGLAVVRVTNSMKGDPCGAVMALEDVWLVKNDQGDPEYWDAPEKLAGFVSVGLQPRKTLAGYNHFGWEHRRHPDLFTNTLVYWERNQAIASKVEWANPETNITESYSPITFASHWFPLALFVKDHLFETWGNGTWKNCQKNWSISRAVLPGLAWSQANPQANGFDDLQSDEGPFINFSRSTQDAVHSDLRYLRVYVQHWEGLVHAVPDFLTDKPYELLDDNLEDFTYADHMYVGMGHFAYYGPSVGTVESTLIKESNSSVSWIEDYPGYVPNNFWTHPHGQAGYNITYTGNIDPATDLASRYDSDYIASGDTAFESDQVIAGNLIVPFRVNMGDRKPTAASDDAGCHFLFGIKVRKNSAPSLTRNTSDGGLRPGMVDTYGRQGGSESEPAYYTWPDGALATNLVSLGAIRKEEDAARAQIMCDTGFRHAPGYDEEDHPGDIVLILENYPIKNPNNESEVWEHWWWSNRVLPSRNANYGPLFAPPPRGVYFVAGERFTANSLETDASLDRGHGFHSELDYEFRLTAP